MFLGMSDLKRRILLDMEAKVQELVDAGLDEEETRVVFGALSQSLNMLTDPYEEREDESAS
jgi:hypothetical protein